MLKELPKIGDKVRYLGGEVSEDAGLSVGSIYEVIGEDLREDQRDVSIRTGVNGDNEWYIYGADHRSGSDLHKYELVAEKGASIPCDYCGTVLGEIAVAGRGAIMYCSNMCADSVEVTQSDAVNSPQHYTQGAVEVIDYIDQVADGYEGKQAYYVGNIIKYVSRAPHKNGVEDLRKAAWYLARLIDAMDAGGVE